MAEDRHVQLCGPVPVFYCILLLYLRVDLVSPLTDFMSPLSLHLGTGMPCSGRKRAHCLMSGTIEKRWGVASFNRITALLGPNLIGYPKPYRA